ncbi:AraC family transcriptional regulator [Pendulispora rubella]|uniref:AraC family transcriptional regulator n=1 Tax=Pendulispora rubella TaxID=2741070 RepID=A0ABZ2L0A1_9BACT
MSTPLRCTVYYGLRRFLLLAPTFILAPATPYRRLTPTLLLSCKGPFQLEVNDDAPRFVRAALIAPKVLRRRVIALDSDMVIFDLPMHSVVTTEPVRVLEFERFAPLLPALSEAFPGKLPAAEADRLFDAAVRLVDETPPEPHHDPRIEQALRLIDELPFDEVTVTELARRLGLSPSRFRHLFKDVTGHTISHYARWAAVWRACSLWSQGRRLTEIAHEVGFHDLAHLDHAFIEVFGLNPSTVIDPENVTLIRCT